MTDSQDGIQEERREYHLVRKIFVPACILLAPLIENNDKSLRLSGYAMVQIVKYNFPELSNVEVQVVIATVERLHREGRLHVVMNGG